MGLDPRSPACVALLVARRGATCCARWLPLLAKQLDALFRLARCFASDDGSLRFASIAAQALRAVCDFLPRCSYFVARSQRVARGRMARSLPVRSYLATSVGLLFHFAARRVLVCAEFLALRPLASSLTALLPATAGAVPASMRGVLYLLRKSASLNRRDRLQAFGAKRLRPGCSCSSTQNVLLGRSRACSGC